MSFSGKNLKKTKVCMYLLVGCPDEKNCSFAHNKDELNFRMCEHGDECRRSNCWFYHPSDELPSKEELFEEAKKEVRFVEKKKETFIINLDDDEEKDEEEKDEEKDEEDEEKDEKESNEDPDKMDVEKDGWNKIVEEMKKDDEPAKKEVVAPPVEKESFPIFQFPVINQPVFPVSSIVFPPIQVQPIPQRQMRVTFEATMNQNEMAEILNFLKFRNMNPSIVSMF